MANNGRSSGVRPSSTRSGLAQLVEQLTVNQRVAGSSPASGATNERALANARALLHLSSRAYDMSAFIAPVYPESSRLL